MENSNCDFSPVKQDIITGIQNLIHQLQSNLNLFGNEDHCVLGGLEAVKEELFQINPLQLIFT
jgi:hypothetical protein